MCIGSPFRRPLAGAEAAAVVGGANPQPAVKCAAHGLDGSEAGAARQRSRSACRPPRAPSARSPRGRSPRTRPASCRPRGRRPGRSCARSCAPCSASAGTERSASTLSGIQACSSRSGRRSASLRGELGAELGLASGALDEQHEPARRGQRRLAPEILLDERQRQVHPGGHAGRGVHVAVAHEDRVRVHLHVRMSARPAARSSPSAWWRGGPSGARPRRAGTLPCRRPRRGASARPRRGAPRGSARRAPAPARRCRPPRRACRSARAPQPSAASGARLTADAVQRAALGRGDRDGVGVAVEPGGGVEDLGGPDHVERLNIRERPRSQRAGGSRRS